MTEQGRNEALLRAILNWCTQIEDAHKQYCHDKNQFLHNSAYRNAVSMCIFQIGENANRLSEGFRSQHTKMPWHQIRGMRNLFAHDCGNMDAIGIRETACSDIPEIERFCKTTLGI